MNKKYLLKDMTWVEFGDGSWSSWKFHFDSFMREMLPLVVVVPLFSLISYFLIAGAVRKYKAYLDSGLDYNQLVRWVGNKEKHAQEIQDIVTAYFMAQRIKPPKNHDDEQALDVYQHKLTLLHHIQIHAMKAKHGTDLDEIETLRKLVAKFRTAYFGQKGEHSH